MFDFISRDDIFVLGNLAGLAIHNRTNRPVKSILKLLQLAQPSNAAAFTLEAKKFLDEGDIKSAIKSLENSAAFEATENRETALILHLILLQMDRQYERALDLAYAYQSEDILSDERSAALLDKIIEDVEFILNHFDQSSADEEELQWT